MPAIAENSNFVPKKEKDILGMPEYAIAYKLRSWNPVKLICIKCVYLLNLYGHENLERPVRSADYRYAGTFVPVHF
jgi:hypothetical protein